LNKCRKNLTFISIMRKDDRMFTFFFLTAMQVLQHPQDRLVPPILDQAYQADQRLLPKVILKQKARIMCEL